MITNRAGENVILLKNRPTILASAAVVGKTEGEGPLSEEFDVCFQDDGIGQSSWENAESKLLQDAIEYSIRKSGISYSDIDAVFAGDLLNQLTASSYALRTIGTSFCGLFGACSTMAYSIALASLCVDGGYMKNAVAATCSHFCSAEKQFRYPLEYGSQRPPSAQRTVTGAGAFVLGGEKKNSVYVYGVLFGKVIDLGITDTSNMGAAMAPVDVKIEP